MKKLTLKTLKEKLSKNFILNDFETIIVKPHKDEDKNDFIIVYKTCLITLNCISESILGSCEGFITSTRMEYLTEFIIELEVLLK